ncbi:MAG TPA: hypothetical protein DGT21_07990 [Armatimonadetes bacterium]|nr:hypothetical protein [Armatimonadota bacterium]
MSRNFKLFLGAAVTFYLAGSMNQAAELFVLAGVCLACILGCYIISRLGVEGLLLRVRPRSGPVWAGKDVEASIELSNIGLIARPPVSVRVELRNATVDAPLEPYLFPLPGLAPGQAVTTTGTVVPACRGEYLLLEPRLIGSDPLGMFDRRGRPAESSAFVALPGPVHISRSDMARMLSEQTRLQMGARRRQTGEFFGIRQHEPGDDLRHVHWKVAAHTGRLVVKQYADGRDYHAAVWLDTRAQSVVGSGLGSSFETQVIAAASLLDALSETNLEIELYGEGLPGALQSADRGRSAYERALFALARVRPAGERSFAANTGDWAGFARHGATVFALTSGIEPAAIATLASLPFRGIGLRVIICGADAPEEQSAAQLEAERRLRAAGVPTVFAASPERLHRAFGELAALRASRGSGVPT